MENNNLNQTSPLSNLTDVSNVVPGTGPAPVKHRVLHTTLLTLLILIVLGLGIGVGYYIKSNNTEKPIQNDSTNKQVVNVTQKPTAIITSTPTTIQSKQVTLTLVSGDNITQEVKILLPDNLKLTKLTDSDTKLNTFSKYRITDTNTPSLLTLEIGNPYESFPVSYTKFLNIGKTTYFDNVYRAFGSTSNKDFWVYTNYLKETGTCESPSDSPITAPCGQPIISKATGGSLDFFLNISCKTTNDANLKICDDIVKGLEAKKI